MDKEDLCVSEGVTTAVLAAEFIDFPPSIVLDATAETDLASEHLLFDRGGKQVLRIVKEFSLGKAGEVFVEATAPTIDGVDHLIMLKQAELQKLGKNLGVEEQIKAAERKKNPPWRKAIFGLNKATKRQNIKIPIAKDDAKKIWDQVKPHIPYFCLFKVDRATSDQDSEAKDPLAAAAKIAIAEKQEEIDAIVAGVEKRATELVTRTLEKLKEMAPDLAVGLTPDVSGHPKWDGFKTTLKTDGNVPFNKRGSGTKRLVLLNFFRAEAERRSEEDGRGIIYAFEEPESSQHPENQRLLLASFKKLAEVKGTQVILTTHAPFVAQNLPINSLRLVSKVDAGACPTIEQFFEGTGEKDALLAKIADQLGVLPDSRVKVLVMVEGPNDVNFFEHIYPAVHSIDSTVVNISASAEVALLPMGGSDLKHWVTKRYLKGLGCIEYHIYDRDCGPDDVASYQDEVNNVNDANDANTARLTSKRETENYIHPTAIKDALGLTLTFTDTCDVPKIVSDTSKKTGDVKDMSQRSAKRQLNTLAAEAMDGNLLMAQDPINEIVGWFREVTQIVNDHQA